MSRPTERAPTRALQADNGLWQVVEHPDELHPRILANVWDDDGTRARLYAAAPDLLAAAEQLNHYFTHDGYDAPNAGSFRTIIRAALAKVKGGGDG